MSTLAVSVAKLSLTCCMIFIVLFLIRAIVVIFTSPRHKKLQKIFIISVLSILLTVVLCAYVWLIVFVYLT